MDSKRLCHGTCLITLYQATGEQQYHDILMSKIAYLRKDALRFGDHVLQHTVSANNDFPEQCWCDTLFMAAFLMLRVGVMEHDEELIDDALNQYYWHIKYLQNPSSGLWYHGYDNIAGDHMSGIILGKSQCLGSIYHVAGRRYSASVLSVSEVYRCGRLLK